MISAAQAKEQTKSVLVGMNRQIIEEINKEINKSSKVGESQVLFDLLNKDFSVDTIVDLLKREGYLVTHVTGGGNGSSMKRYNYLRICW